MNTEIDTSQLVVKIFEILESVKDPEIPVISIRELGILQQVKIAGATVKVGIIPTYSGCPAMFVITEDIINTLYNNGFNDVKVELLNEPVWNTEMISDSGKKAMKAYGIAPPLSFNEKIISCPQCGSTDTTCISQFGSTACKALYRCENCLEPFDYFKCHA
ncbi:MAG: phenylacetate-CoA oxygenase subunit PaaJ [Xanthomonadales bacterium]|nr:phenylacetate-CoA oxygenase subunit PaaJ [Xanthomonadales bacterium]